MRLTVLVIIGLCITSSVLSLAENDWISGQYNSGQEKNVLQRNDTKPLPDLAFYGNINVHSLDGALYDGAPCYILVSIINIGNISAENITVVLKSNNVVIKKTVVPVIEIDEKILLNISWKCRMGDQQLKFEIDPENNITEENDQFIGINNNVKTRNLFVSGPGSNTIPILLILIIIAIPLFLIIAIVIIGIILYRRSHSKKKK